MSGKEQKMIIKEKTYLDIKSCIETHLEVAKLILVEHTEETLLEDRRGERIGQYNNTIGRVR